MIGARKETRSQTKEMSSPRNESMERADLTMEDWIQETCLISAVTSGPTEPKTFQQAWHYPVKSERDSWRVAIQKEIRSMIERGVWRKQTEKGYPVTEDLLEINGCSRSKEMALTEQDWWHWDTAKFQEWTTQIILLQLHMMYPSGLHLQG